MTLAQAQVMRGDTGFTSFDAAFHSVVGARPALRHVVDVDAHEGPVYVADEDALYFTTLPRRGQVLIKRLGLREWGLGPAASGVTVVPADTCLANGMTLARDGAVVVCEQGPRTGDFVYRWDPVTHALDAVDDSSYKPNGRTTSSRRGAGIRLVGRWSARAEPRGRSARAHRRARRRQLHLRRQDRNLLFITTDAAVRAAVLDTQGT